MSVADEKVSLDLANCSVGDRIVRHIGAPVYNPDAIIEYMVTAVESPGV